MTSASLTGNTPPLRAQEMILDLLRLPDVLRERFEWQSLAAALQRVDAECTGAPIDKQLQQELGISASKYRS